MNSQKPVQHAQDLHMSRMMGFQALRIEVDTSLHPGNCLQFYNCWQMKNQFSVIKPHWVYIPLLRPDTMPSKKNEEHKMKLILYLGFICLFLFS